MLQAPGYEVVDGTYIVYTAKGLQAWAEAVKSTPSTSCTLAADIDMTGLEWVQVGGPYSDTRFSGTFDGGGHTISNLKAAYPLIYSAENNATIKDVTLVSPEINANGNFYIGGILRYSGVNVTLLNCHVVGGSITGGSNAAGGIVGYNSGSTKIYACSSTANVGDNNCENVGGICSGIATMVACYYAGGELTGETNVGGIMGNRTAGNISSCYWSGNAEKGVGKGKTDGTTKVEGDVDWDDAMEAMNKALSDAGYSQYKWVKNTGDDADSRPLVIEMN